MSNEGCEHIVRRAKEDAENRIVGFLAVLRAGGASENESRLMRSEILNTLAAAGRWQVWTTLLRGMGSSEEELLEQIKDYYIRNLNHSPYHFYRAVRSSGIVTDDSSLDAALNEVADDSSLVAALNEVADDGYNTRRTRRRL